MGSNSKEAYYGGLEKTFLLVGHIPVQMFLLVNYFFDAATHTSNRMFFKGQ